MTTRVILASGSPRRRELLAAMGVSFEVRTSGVDESRIPADHPRTFANRAAWLKAKAVAENESAETVVIAADTIVTISGMLLGKPANEAEARQMLRRLSGNSHDVITAVAVARGGENRLIVDSDTTRVIFNELTAAEIDHYIRSGGPMDKAGAYGIQEIGDRFIERIDGDWFNVMGLPCSLLTRMLEEMAPELGALRMPHKENHGSLTS